VSIYGFPEYDVRNFGKVRSFTDIFSYTYQRVSLFDKPIIIAELGVTAVIAINATGSNARSEAFVGTQSYKWRCTITVKIVRLRAGKIIQYRTGEFYTPFSMITSSGRGPVRMRIRRKRTSSLESHGRYSTTPDLWRTVTFPLRLSPDPAQETARSGGKITFPWTFTKVRPRSDKRDFDLISDVLPLGCLWYAEPNAISNTIGYAKFYSLLHAT